MNSVDIVLIVLIVGAVVAALLVLRRNKKHGRSCCGDCASCETNCSMGREKNNR